MPLKRRMPAITTINATKAATKTMENVVIQSLS
jgi:hypothetical protein